MFETLILRLSSLATAAGAATDSLNKTGEQAKEAASAVAAVSKILLALPNFGATMKAATDVLPNAEGGAQKPPSSDVLHYEPPGGSAVGSDVLHWSSTGGGTDVLRATPDILPNSGGPSGPLLGTFNTLFKLKKVADDLAKQIADLPSQADAAARQVGEQLGQAASQASSQFEDLLRQIANFPGYKFGEGDEGGAFAGQDLLEQLEALTRRMEHQERLSPQMLVDTTNAIQNLIRLIQMVGGTAGQNFHYEEFVAWLRKHQPPSSNSSSGQVQYSVDTLFSTGQL